MAMEKRHSKIFKRDRKSNADVTSVIDFVLQSGGIEYADQKMRSIGKRRCPARNGFDTMPESEARQSLKRLGSVHHRSGEVGLLKSVQTRYVHARDQQMHIMGSFVGND